MLDELAVRHGLSFRPIRGGEECRLAGVRLFKPGSYMNLSGAAVQSAASADGTKPGELLVVQDDLDLPLGRLRFKQGGGAGGQRGVRDIISRMGSDFWRLKVGISRPPPGWQVENWVLSRFREEELELLGKVVAAAATGVEKALSDGLNAAMNELNGINLADGGGLPEA